MIAKAATICRQLFSAEDKLDWLKDKLAWQLFQVRLRRQALRNAGFDRTHSTDTAADICLERAGLTATQARRGNTIYRVFWEDSFEAIFDDLPIDHGQFTFVDIGAGKGKLLLLASHYPFRRIVGVELAPLLHEIALRNIGTYHSPDQRCTELFSVLGDALLYELPDDALVCLMVNPFDRATIARVLGRIADHAQTCGKPVLAIYANMRRIDEVAGVFDHVGGLDVLVRRRNHVILGNAAAARLLAAGRT